MWGDMTGEADTLPKGAWPCLLWGIEVLMPLPTGPLGGHTGSSGLLHLSSHIWDFSNHKLMNQKGFLFCSWDEADRVPMLALLGHC